MAYISSSSWSISFLFLQMSRSWLLLSSVYWIISTLVFVIWSSLFGWWGGTTCFESFLHSYRGICMRHGLWKWGGSYLATCFWLYSWTRSYSFSRLIFWNIKDTFWTGFQDFLYSLQLWKFPHRVICLPFDIFYRVHKHRIFYHKQCISFRYSPCLVEIHVSCRRTYCTSGTLRTHKA